MHSAHRPASLVTGAASGLGRSIALHLAHEGHNLTLLDLDVDGLAETARQIRGSAAASGAVVVHPCFDITDAAAQQAAFAQHAAHYGRLDVAVLSAGIGERGAFFDEAGAQWQKTLDVDLTAVLVGIRCAVDVMTRTKSVGTILSIASAGGIFPMPASPVYAAAKSALVQFTRSAASSLFKQTGIRLMSLCPEFVDTPLVRDIKALDPETARRVLGSLDVALLQPEAVAQVALDLALDKQHPAGSVVLLRQDGSAVRLFPQRRTASPFADIAPPFVGRSSTTTSSSRGGGSASTSAPAEADSQQRRRRAAWAAGALPSSYRKLQVTRLSTNFAEATQTVQVAMPGVGGGGGGTVPEGHLLVRRAYVGINASDINFSAGRYFGSTKEAASRLPFDAGFESVNVVVSCGADVKGFQVGDAVAAMSYGSFSEYGLLPVSHALPVPRADAAGVALLTSGLTASIALEVAGHMRQGEVVLVTAAAGGTGQFAVQLAKLAGCTVVATCSSSEKADLLRQLGADRVVNYKTEDLQAVLKAEYPRGVDVVYESVGGAMFTTAVNALAPRGRLIVIGMISQYEEGWPATSHVGLPEKLLWKSASVTGFFLLKYPHLFKSHLQKLFQLVEAGKLRVEIDKKRFVGLDSVGAAVSWLYSGASSGKVVVQMTPKAPPTDGIAHASKL